MEVFNIEPTPAALRALRTAKGITQDKAAELMGLGAKSRVSEYENGAVIIDQLRWEILLLRLDMHPLYGRR